VAQSGLGGELSLQSQARSIDLGEMRGLDGETPREQLAGGAFLV
jgi:hypothetical protein